MIRNTLFGISMLALTAGSAFAAPKHPVAKPHVVAQAGDTAAPAADKPAKKATKKSAKKVKAEPAKAEAKMKAPAPETK